MTKVWKKRAYLEMDSNITSSPTSKYVETNQNWCPYCNNAESIVRYAHKLSNKVLTVPYQIIIEAIRKNDLKFFETKDIVKLTNAQHLTNNTLQNKVLSILCILGYIRKEIREYTIEINGKEIRRTKFIFYVNDKILPTKCYDPIKDVHSFDWTFGRKTRYYN